MSVSLPSDPYFVSCTPRLVSSGNDLTSPVGQAVQRIFRLGDKFAADIVMPPMVRATADKWFSKLMQGMRSTVVFDWPLPDAGVGTPGAPLVNGAGQIGTSLTLDGFTALYPIKDGQFFSIVQSGRRYLHMVTADVTASGDGQATVSFLPMLRISPSDNAVVEFAQPKIEGLIQADDLRFPIGVDHIVALTFSITEQV